jgi:hypothetical protein
MHVKRALCKRRLKLTARLLNPWGEMANKPMAITKLVEQLNRELGGDEAVGRVH